MALISLGARLKLNAEALNMVESVGNYVRHRRVPIAFKKGDEFVLRYVPAISGESIAHGYQVILASLAHIPIKVLRGEPTIWRDRQDLLCA